LGKAVLINPSGVGFNDKSLFDLSDKLNEPLYLALSTDGAFAETSPGGPVPGTAWSNTEQCGVSRKLLTFIKLFLIKTVILILI